MPPIIVLPGDEELEPDQRELLARLPPLNIFRMMAGAPRAMRPFLQLGSAVLTTALDARRREIAVLRVAVATGARYEWAQHEQLARTAGVTQAELDAVATERPVCSLDEECNLICRVADEVSREVRLSDEALAAIVDRYGPREAAELILLVSYYNMVSRFLESTRVQLEEEPLLEGQTPGAMARRTASMIGDEGGVAECVAGDWTDAASCAAFASACVERWERIDFLQNNVGIGTGDARPLELSEEAFDQIVAVNLKGCLLSCQAVAPLMRERGSGSIVNISSIAALATAVPLTAYKISKAGINALSHSLAADNAAHGVRVNAIMPGLLDTPMAIDAWAATLRIPRERIRAQRDAMVPLRARMGSGWDVAYASLFLHSDEASFITGALLPVDGGQLTRVGG